MVLLAGGMSAADAERKRKDRCVFLVSLCLEADGFLKKLFKRAIFIRLRSQIFELFIGKRAQL
jgi:hypothetical protein